MITLRNGVNFIPANAWLICDGSLKVEEDDGETFKLLNL
jgi:hypothetical protein